MFNFTNAVKLSEPRIYFFCFRLRTTKFFGHEEGGVKHILSLRVKAHFPTIPLFAQMSGLLWRHPKVCFSVSRGCSGLWGASGFLFIVLAFVYQIRPAHSTPARRFRQP
jgi:hypothetical protein